MALAAAIAVKPIGGLGPTLLMAIGAAIFAVGHPFPPGPIGIALFGLGIAWLEVRRPTQAPEAQPVLAPEREGERSCKHPQKHNVAARMARWSAHHRKTAIFGWLAFVIAAFAISISSPPKSIVFETSGPGESGRADTILYEDFKQPGGESVLIQNAKLRATPPGSRPPCSICDQRRRGSRRGREGRVAVRREENSGQVPTTSTPCSFRSRSGASDDAADKVDPIVDRVQRCRRRTPTSPSGPSARAPARRSFGDIHERSEEGRRSSRSR